MSATITIQVPVVCLIHTLAYPGIIVPDWMHGICDVYTKLVSKPKSGDL